MEDYKELVRRLKTLNKTKKRLKKSCKFKKKQINFKDEKIYIQKIDEQKSKIQELEKLLYTEKLLTKKLQGKLTAIKLYSKKNKK